MKQRRNLVEKTINSNLVYEGKIFNVKKDDVLLPSGKKSFREIIIHPGAAAVIPCLPDNTIILVKQYRYPIQAITLEIPAGKLDVVGESLEECALRELTEETGYFANKLTKLISIATTVGFSNEIIHIYLAEELSLGTQRPDEDEILNVERVSLPAALNMITTGQIIDAKTICALLLLKEFLEKRKV